MAYAVTLAQIVTRAQQRSNLEGAGAFVPFAEWASMVNSSLADWYDMVRLTTFAGQYYRSINQITTSPAVDQYALPGDFLSVISIDWFVSGNPSSSSANVVTLRPFQEEDRNRYRFWPTGWLATNPVFYQLWGPNLKLIPVPQSSFYLQLNYVPAAPRLGNPAATLDSIDGWEEWIVLDVAMKALVKDGQIDILPMLQQERQRQEMRIKGAAAARDVGRAEIVHDVSGGGGYGDWGW